MQTTATHFLVVDSDDRSVLAWFSFATDGEDAALDQAATMAYGTGHEIMTGYWTGSAFKIIEKVWTP